MWFFFRELYKKLTQRSRIDNVIFLAACDQYRCCFVTPNWFLCNFDSEVYFFINDNLWVHYDLHGKNKIASIPLISLQAIKYMLNNTPVEIIDINKKFNDIDECVDFLLGTGLFSI